MVASDDGNGRFDWLRDDMKTVKRQLNILVKSDADTRATVRSHGAALKWLFGIVGTVFLMVVAIALGVR